MPLTTQDQELLRQLKRYQCRIISWSASDFDEETLISIPGFHTLWHTFDCAVCGEEHEVLYTLAPDLQGGRALVRQGRAVCQQCLLESLHDAVILKMDR